MSPNGAAGAAYTNELGNHAFLPWIRRGVGTYITAIDGGGPAGQRAKIDVLVDIKGGTQSTGNPVAFSGSLYGPSDVKALDPRAVIRTWPRPNVFEAEPNYFPLIELDPPDLPWRYTPASAGSGHRLRPWLCIVALRDDEITRFDSPSVSQPIGMVTVKSAASLPPLDQAWAWAHVQVSGLTIVDPASVLDVLDNEPHRVVARLLCPRRLEERTAYTGMLVPTLKLAQLAGLGRTADSSDGLDPAWTPDASDVQLPVYYQWRFQTGGAGDFESLVRRIKTRPMPATVGSRPMSVSSAGFNLPAAAGAPLSVEAALRALDSESTDWSDDDYGRWTSALEPIVNGPAQLIEGSDAAHTIAPPLYGRWYAAQATLQAGIPQPGTWFAELNADPRTRVAAGLGTLVVQNQQQSLLAGAWAQVPGIRAANAALRQAQLAREAAVRVYERHLSANPPASVLAFSAPTHPRIPATSQTVAAVLQSSPLSIGVLNAAWRRVSRPLGPLGRRLTRAGGVAGPSVLERVNQATLRVSLPPSAPSNLVTWSQAGRKFAPSWVTPQFLSHVRALPLVGPALSSTKPMQHLALGVALRSGTLTAQQILQAPRHPAFVPSEAGAAPVATVPNAVDVEHPAAARFRVAAAAVFGQINAQPAPGRVLQPADLADLSAKTLQALDPRVTISQSYRERLMLADGVVWNPPDPLEPVMPAPSFTDPMYWPLYQLSQDWLLPGLDQVPADTVSLVRTNEKFIEAYMVGLNHEMARTLLFNEYPTDQRGTYFRQFWDSTGVTTATGKPPDAESLKDIEPIDRWGKHSNLGSHSSRPVPSSGDQEFLVLLLRAELLRRYPNCVVYAMQAKWGVGGRQLDDSVPVQDPVFQGRLGSGVGFWGFDLTAKQVRGGDQPSADAGWYFILQEPPTEPRYGLEPPSVSGDGSAAPSNWQDLGWSDLAAAGALGLVNYIDLNAALPDTTKIQDASGAIWHAAAGACASDLAYITYRIPVRIAVHGSKMMPDPGPVPRPPAAP